MTIDPQTAVANLARCKEDPWFFLTSCVFTRDQVDATTPIKRFPQEWDYLRLFVRTWQKHKLIAVPKSRRMFMSWCNIGLHLWAALFFPGQDYALVSKKEDDAGELIRKAEFIYDHIPQSVLPKSILPKKETRAKPAALIFPEIGSKLQGFPMGADQLRQFTFSGVLGDESAFWEEARQFYSATFPTIEGGGRMTLISSRSPGFFQRLVYDQLDNDDSVDVTQTPAQVHPLGDDSVIIWRNPKNRFLVFDLHYTANPKKRDPTFRETLRASMPIKDFMVEYERNWESYDGKAVFEDYSKSRHESLTPLQPHLGLPLLIGWDFGLTPAAIVAQLRDGRLFILREYVAAHSSIQKFCPEVLSSLATRYPQWNDARRDFRHYIDPAGLAESQVNQRTCAQEMMTAGCRNVFPGPIDWESRRKAVEHFLITHTKAGAGLVLHARDCPTLSQGFSGGYHYPEKYQQVEPGKPVPVKDRHSHPHDALQYLAGGALALMGRGRTLKEIPVPTYLFTQPQGVTP